MVLITDTTGNKNTVEQRYFDMHWIETGYMED